MSNRKTSLYALLLLSLASCKKELSPAASISEPAGTKLTSANTAVDASQNATTFGLMVAQGSVSNVQSQMATANVSLVRVPLYLSKTTVGLVINQYINDGYKIQVNLNWSPSSRGPAPYPRNTTLIRKQADAFFKYYQPYKSQIPLIVVENEWDNTNYHSGTIQDYLTELSIITDVGHQYGFKISDGGLTSNGLRRWEYSQLSGDAANQWRSNYYVGLNINNYNMLIKTINDYAVGVQSIPVDYINVHWYNESICANGFTTASKTYLSACKKSSVICNEFGIRTNSEDLFDQTVAEIKNNVSYALAYSGTGAKDQAVTLTNDMLTSF